MGKTGDSQSSTDHGVAGELAHDRTFAGKDRAVWSGPAGRTLARTAHRVAHWLGPHLALIITLIVGMAAVVGLSVLATEVYDAVTDEDGIAGLDKPLLEAAISIRTPWLNDAATVFTDIAGVVVMPIIAVGTMLLLAFLRRSWTPIILIGAAGAGSLLMTVVGKRLIGRTRPDLADAVPPFESSASFPSGHTLNAIVIAGIIAYLLVLRQHHRWLQILTVVAAVLFALTVAATRVYLGHHWLTDVVAALLLGGAWLALVITAHRLYLTVRAGRAGQGGAPGAHGHDVPAPNSGPPHQR